jgi:hypothetical protein
VVAHADQRPAGRVAGRQGAEFGHRRGLVDRRWQVERLVAADRGGHGLRGDVVQADGADGGQHRGDFRL